TRSRWLNGSGAIQSVESVAVVLGRRAAQCALERDVHPEDDDRVRNARARLTHAPAPSRGGSGRRYVAATGARPPLLGGGSKPPGRGPDRRPAWWSTGASGSLSPRASAVALDRRSAAANARRTQAAPRAGGWCTGREYRQRDAPLAT